MKYPKYIIPNMFTGLNMVIGLLSMYSSVKGDFLNAAWLILLSMIMDKLDGTTARLFKASSLFGTEFDSFSDFVSFGFAPATLVFNYFNQTPAWKTADLSYLHIGIAFYILLAAVRLAKYNAVDADNHEYFSGLTSTQSGAMIAAWTATALTNGWLMMLTPKIMAGMLFVHAVLMVTPFKYSKLRPRKSPILNVIQIGAIALLPLLVLIRELPYVLYAAGALYVSIATLVMWQENHAALKRSVEMANDGENEQP